MSLRTLHLFHLTYVDYRTNPSGETKVLRISSETYNHTTSPGQYYRRVLSDEKASPVGLPNYDRALSVDANGDSTLFGATQVSVGELVLANIDGFFDAYDDIDVVFDGQAFEWLVARFDPGEGLPLYTAFASALVGTLEPPAFGLDTVSIRLRDRVEDMQNDLQTRLFTGDVGSADNTEGAAGDIKDQVWPVLLGYVFNAPLKNANTGKNIYPLSDVPVDAISAARDGGATISAGVARATKAAMTSNTPTSGQFDTFLGTTANPEALVRTDAATDQTMTVDAVGPSRTNILLRSEDFTHAAWTASNVTVTANQATAPDGTVTADLVTDASASDGSLDQSGTVTGSTTAKHVDSIYVKAGTLTTCRIRFRLSGGTGIDVTATFDLSAGSVTSQPASGVAYIWPAAQGFYRCCVQVPNNGSANTTQRLTLLTGSTAADQGTLYVWGAQAEQGIVSPYIATAAATVKRAFQYPGECFWYLLTQRKNETPTKVSDKDVLALNVARPWKMGRFSGDVESFADVADWCAKSAGAYWYKDKSDIYRIVALAVPSGGVVRFRRLSGVSTIAKSTDSNIITLDRKPYADPALRRPVLGVRVGYKKAWFVQTDGLDAAITAADKEALGQEYRYAIYPDASTRLARQAKWPNARLYTHETGLWDAADALSLATIIDGLLSTPRIPYEVSAHLDAMLVQNLDLGSVAQLMIGRYGLDAGQDFLVMRQIFEGPSDTFIGELFG
jgi:hypothetical protein